MLLSIENHVPMTKFGFEKSVEILKAAGFNAIDFSYYWAEDADFLRDEYVEVAKRYRKILDDNHMVCNQAHAPFDFHYGDAMDNSCKGYLAIARSIESASILGAQNIIVHSIRVPDGVDFIEYNLKFYKSFEPLCEKFNIHISVENLWQEDGGKIVGRLHIPEEITEFVKRLESPWFNICLDLSHAAITGVMPEEFILKMDKSMLKALHVHDSDYKNDLHWIPYLGEHNWDNITDALSKIGYDGDFTFEIFGSLSKVPAGLLPAALRFAASVGEELVKKIGG